MHYVTWTHFKSAECSTETSYFIQRTYRRFCNLYCHSIIHARQSSCFYWIFSSWNIWFLSWKFLLLIDQILIIWPCVLKISYVHRVYCLEHKLIRNVFVKDTLKFLEEGNSILKMNPKMYQWSQRRVCLGVALAKHNCICLNLFTIRTWTTSPSLPIGFSQLLWSFVGRNKKP